MTSLNSVKTRMRTFARLSAALVIFTGVMTTSGSGCGETSRSVSATPPVQSTKPSLREATSAHGDIQTAGIVVGDFALKRIVDGDTLEVVGADKLLRLILLDTEEVFHSRADREAAAKDFKSYRRRLRSTSPRPQKGGTPTGEAAKQFARDFFADVQRVRVERDHPQEIRDTFGRYLTYVFVEKNGKTKLFNLECVRAGMSPYFTKYGQSRRFHKEFVAAQAEAKRHHRGIWDPTAHAYGDYDERLPWWNARGQFIESYRRAETALTNVVELSHDDALSRLRALVDKDVTVVGVVSAIERFGSMRRVTVERIEGRGFPLIFFDIDVFDASGIATMVSEPVAVTGKVSLYTKYGQSQLQIEVERANQVATPKLPPPQL